MRLRAMRFRQGSSPGRAGLIAALALAIAAVLAIAAAPALASPPAFEREITEANGEALVEPWGMTTDSSANLFIGDQNNSVVDLLEAGGGEHKIGAGEFTEEELVRSVAVDNASGYVYVAESGDEQIYVFKPLGGGSYELVQRAQAERFIYVAFDNGPGANHGDLYLIEAPRHVAALVTDPVTHLLGEGNAEESLFEEEFQENYVEPGYLTPPDPEVGFELTGESGNGQTGLTVDGSTGELYLAEAGHGPNEHAVSQYTSAGVFDKQLKAGESGTPSTFEPTGVAVDETGGHLYVIDAHSRVVDIFSTATDAAEGKLEKAGNTGTYVFTAPRGIAVQNAGPDKGDVYVSDEGHIDVFEAEEEPVVSGPPLTLNIEEGTGTVVSNPAGLECNGSEGESCTTEEIEEGSVTLTASPAAGYLFKGWKYCDSGGVHGRQCTIDLAEPGKTVGAKFTPAHTVTVEKAPDGLGSVSGVTCPYSCTEATVSFANTKAAKLKAKAYKTADFAGWEGDVPGSCESPASTECLLPAGSSDLTVEPTFVEKTKETLDVAKTGNGEGLVKSKPAGVSCSYTCGSVSAFFYEGTAVELSEAVKSGKGSEFVEWTGGTGSAASCNGSSSPTCSFTIEAASSIEAKFE